MYTIAGLARRTHGGRKICACNEGATVVEFAVIAPVIILLMMGIIEFSLIMFTTAVIESATTNTSRMGKTGYVEQGRTRQQQLLSNIASITGGFLDINRFTITTTTYSSFSNVNRPEPYIDANHNGQYTNGESYTDINGNGQWDADMGAAGAGTGGDIVLYTINYPWPIMTPVIRAILGNTYPIQARTVVKNEPF